MSCTNPESEFEALVHLAERLRRRFPGCDEYVVFELIAGELEALGDVQLRDYVPVLVERNVVRALRSAHVRAA